MFARPTEHNKQDASGLTTKEDRELLQSIAKSRDEMNRRMTWKDMVALISTLFSVSNKAAENHSDYHVRHKKFPELKLGGCVVSAQATTTNRTAITTQKLLRTYNAIQLAWARQAECNGWNIQGGEEDDGRLCDYFTINLDETCFVASKVTLLVIGSAAKQKHEKNTSDSRQSVTVVRLGLAAGVEGPRIYLAKGKDLKIESMYDKNFVRVHKAPVGSHVKMTPNAYMTNEVWTEIAPGLCKGIRAMEGICNHPNWWIV